MISGGQVLVLITIGTFLILKGHHKFKTGYLKEGWEHRGYLSYVRAFLGTRQERLTPQQTRFIGALEFGTGVFALLAVAFSLLAQLFGWFE